MIYQLGGLRRACSCVVWPKLFNYQGFYCLKNPFKSPYYRSNQKYSPHQFSDNWKYLLVGRGGGGGDLIFLFIMYTVDWLYYNIISEFCTLVIWINQFAYGDAIHYIILNKWSINKFIIKRTILRLLYVVIKTFVKHTLNIIRQFYYKEMLTKERFYKMWWCTKSWLSKYCVVPLSALFVN